MDRESRARASAWIALGSTVKTDRLVQATYAAFAVTAAFYLLPLIGQAERAWVSRVIGPLIFLSLAVAALAAGLERLGAEERRFWRDVVAAFAAWLAAAALFLVFPQVDKPLAADLALEALYAVYYAAFVLAAARRPDRAQTWRATRFERALAWPPVVVFVLGLVGYFILIPLLEDPGASDRSSSSYALYLTLDAYLSIRFGILAAIAGTVRWRTLYLVLAATALTVLFNDLLEVSAYADAAVKWGATLDLVYYLPFLVIVLSRVRHYAFPPTAPPPGGPDPIPFSEPRAQTLLYALAFPVIHYGASTLGLLPSATRSARETLVFTLLLLLGLIGVVQQRLFVRKAREMWRDRERLQASLLDREKDLRVMVERYHTGQKLEAAEEKFAKALRASADVIAVSSMADGRIADVNDSFVAVTGYPREELLGRTSAEIELWADPEDRERMVRTLEQEGVVRGLRARFRTKSGGRVTGVLAAETLSIDGEPYLLTVTHIVPDGEPPEEGAAAPRSRPAAAAPADGRRRRRPAP